MCDPMRKRARQLQHAGDRKHCWSALERHLTGAESPRARESSDVLATAPPERRWQCNSLSDSAERATLRGDSRIFGADVDAAVMGAAPAEL
mmetsp:Transcript_285/g.945  ORF Transcript_285/g.945 Transcript_285/m.945 type:complete len:91 (-) Transcript_285:4-276(-)